MQRRFVREQPSRAHAGTLRGYEVTFCSQSTGVATLAPRAA